MSFGCGFTAFFEENPLITAILLAARIIRSFLSGEDDGEENTCTGGAGPVGITVKYGLATMGAKWLRGRQDGQIPGTGVFELATNSD